MMRKDGVLLVGAGHMGSALLNLWSNEDVVVVRRTPKEHTQPRQYTFESLPNRTFSMAILATPPGTFKDVAKHVRPLLQKDTLVVSVMAGIPITTLTSVYPQQAIMRIMPNIAVAIGRGIILTLGTSNISPKQRDFFHHCFEPAGLLLPVTSDRDLDVMTAITGSGPAYVFYFMELLKKHIIKYCPTQKADHVIRQLFEGSVALTTAMPQKNFGTLKRSIMTKGGMTEAAILAMEKNGLEKAVGFGIESALDVAKHICEDSDS